MASTSADHKCLLCGPDFSRLQSRRYLRDSLTIRIQTLDPLAQRTDSYELATTCSIDRLNGFLVGHQWLIRAIGPLGDLGLMFMYESCHVSKYCHVMLLRSKDIMQYHATLKTP